MSTFIDKLADASAILRERLQRDLYGDPPEGWTPPPVKDDSDFKVRHFSYGKESIIPVKSTGYFCNNCGAKGLCCDMTGGDYYIGETYYCLECKHQMHIPSGTEPVAGLERVEE